MLDREIAFPSGKNTTAQDAWKGDHFCLVSVHCQVNFIELVFSEKWGLITNLPFQKMKKTPLFCYILIGYRISLQAQPNSKTPLGSISELWKA